MAHLSMVSQRNERHSPLSETDLPNFLNAGIVAHKNIWILGELSVTLLSFVGSLLSGRALELSKTSGTTSFTTRKTIYCNTCPQFFVSANNCSRYKKCLYRPSETTDT
jgi:hypothetical protein